MGLLDSDNCQEIDNYYTHYTTCKLIIDKFGPSGLIQNVGYYFEMLTNYFSPVLNFRNVLLIGIYCYLNVTHPASDRA